MGNRSMGGGDWGELWPNVGSVLGERVLTACGGIAVRPCCPFSVGRTFIQTLLFRYREGLFLEFYKEKVSGFDSIAYHTLLIAV